jgi:hypothetical protein
VFEILGKSMNVSISGDITHFERRIENWMNLRHPCISSTTIFGLCFTVRTYFSITRMVDSDSESESDSWYCAEHAIYTQFWIVA